MRFKLILLALFYIIGTLWAMPKLLAGGFLNAIEVAAMLLPLLLMLLIRWQQYWWLIFVGYSLLPYIPVPIPFVDAVGGAGGLLLISVIGMFIATMAMNKGRVFIRQRWVYTVMVALFIFVIIRISANPPGSARVGATGGMGQAMDFIIATLSMPAGYFVARNTGNMKKGFRTLLVMAALSVCYSIGRSVLSGNFYMGFLYDWRLWFITDWLMLGAMVKAMQRHGRSFLSFYGLAGVALALAAINPHRRGILIALTQIGTIMLLYRGWRKTLPVAAIMAVMVFAVIYVLYAAGVEAELVKRTVSLVSTVDTSMGGEYGWKSAFRTEMNHWAWVYILKHPWWGNGFAFSTEEILNLVSFGFTIELIAFTGGFHNILLIAAVKCGLPMAAMFTAMLIAIFWRVWRWTSARGNDDAKRWIVMLAAYSSGSLIYALLNGGTLELLFLCTPLGVMCAWMDRADALLVKPRPARPFTPML